MSNINDVRIRAMDLLARREHSQYELTQKLIQKGFDAQQVDVVVAQLSDENLVSDERYVESYVRSRANKGFGPIKIRLELVQRRVSENLIAEHFRTLPNEFWRDVLHNVWQKKYARQYDGSVNAKAKALRALQNKGFVLDDIYSLLSETSNEKCL